MSNLPLRARARALAYTARLCTEPTAHKRATVLEPGNNSGKEGAFFFFGIRAIVSH